MMIEMLLDEASKECLCSLMTDFHGRLSKSNPDLADELEDILYGAVYGPHFNAWTYKKAVDALKSKDGKGGPHWSLDDIRSLMRSKGLKSDDWNDYDFAYAMNMTWSDYSDLVGGDETVCKMALAFLNDSDGPSGKAYIYWKKVICSQ